MPSSELIRRLALALVIAVAAAAVLWWSIERAEARETEVVPTRRAEVPRRPDASHVVLPPGFPGGRAATIALARDLRGARGAAPVAEIRAGGGVRLVRAAPAPRVPGSAPPPWRAALILPRTDLVDLSPRERAALLELLRAWSGGVAVEPEQLRAAGVRYRPEDLAAVLRWQR